MKHISRRYVVALAFTGLIASACGGGGGGDDAEDAVPSSPNISAKWAVSAAVSKDGCGERISNVTQNFTFTGTEESGTVNTGLVSIPVGKTETGVSAGFAETNGTCSRSYQADFSDFTETTANVHLVATSNCEGAVCTNEWLGTATRVN